MSDEEIKSMHIAVYALSLIGGAHRKVHTEDIAVKCFEIAKRRFKWERYDYPEKELVRKALFHAGEKKNGGLVVGRSGMEQRGKSRDGWQLTPAGADWLSKNEATLQRALAQTSAVIPKHESVRFLKKMRSERAFQIFLATRSLTDVSQYMFTDLLNCSPDASPDTIRIKFDRILSQAKLVRDKDALDFLAACSSHFATLLANSTRATGGSV